MRLISYTLALILAAVNFPSNASQIYQYVNDSGRKIYVNRLSQVPAKYKHQLKKRATKNIENTAQQQAAYDLENQQYANSIALRSKISKLRNLKAAISTQVNVSGNQVIVPVDIDYKGSTQSLNLLLDTGASVTVLHARSMKKLNKLHLKSSLAKVAGGALIKTWLLNLGSLSFGPYDYSDKQVVVIDFSGESKFDGLLGMDVLAQTDYKIDYDKQRILWDEGAMSKLEQRISIMSLELEQLK